MPHLHRYLLVQMLTTMLMVLFGLLSIVWLNNGLRMLELVVNKGAPFAEFLVLAFLPVPLWLMVALPLAGFIGVIWVIYKFATDRELTVMQAIGLSPFQFSVSVMIFGSLLSGFLFINSLSLLPAAFTEFKEAQFRVRAAIPKILIQDGVFVDLGDRLTLYIEKKVSGQEVNKVFIQDSRNEDMIVTYTSEKGRFTIQQGRPIFELTNGQRIELDSEGRAAASLSFSSHSLDISQRSDRTGSRFADSNEESVLSLLDPTQSPEPRYVSQRQAMAHYRLASPLSAFALCVMAAAFMLVGYVTRKNILWRIAAVSIAGILMQSLIVMARGIIIETPASWPVIYLVSLIPACLSLYALYQPVKTYRVFSSMARIRPASRQEA